LQGIGAAATIMAAKIALLYSDALMRSPLQEKMKILSHSDYDVTLAACVIRLCIQTHFRCHRVCA
jgi:hypothetical protein